VLLFVIPPIQFQNSVRTTLKLVGAGDTDPLSALPLRPKAYREMRCFPLMTQCSNFHPPRQ